MYFEYMLSEESEKTRGAAELPDIAGRPDIEILVNSFYDQVREDPSLGPIFDGAIENNWPAHLKTMYDFWESILFRTGSFKGNPPLKHLLVHEKTPLTSAHFQQWLALFQKTLGEKFAGPKANFAKNAAQDIASVLQRRLGINGDAPQFVFTN